MGCCIPLQVVVLQREVKTPTPYVVLLTNRSYNAWTTRLLAEWIAINLPHASAQNEVKLGPLVETGVSTPTASIAAGISSNARGRIDALCWDATSVYLIEAKPRASHAAVGQLVGYVRMFPLTPELSSLLGHILKPILLVAQDDPMAREYAASVGVDVEVYAPDWWTAQVGKVQAQQAERNAAINKGTESEGRRKIRQNIIGT